MNEIEIYYSVLGDLVLSCAMVANITDCTAPAVKLHSTSSKSFWPQSAGHSFVQWVITDLTLFHLFQVF